MERELQEFRSKWKEELNAGASLNAPGIQGEIVQGGVGADQDQNKKATPSSSQTTDKTEKSNAKIDSLSNADRIKSQPNTLEPFLLAERLLEESNSTTPSRRESLGSPTYKTLKRGSADASDLDLLGSFTGKKRKTEESKDVRKKDTTYLDAFLADLDEINEIPFFEMSLPREIAMKIFRFLDIHDLCRCAQVSRAWQSLAEDEVLWCAIAHRMKYEVGSVPLDKFWWKNIVRDYIVHNRLRQANWKTRTGRSKQLQYPQGGVLRDAHSSGDKVVLGFTSGDVKFWRVAQHGEECVFKPSNTSLALLDVGEDDLGTAGNVVTKVNVNDTHVVAGYSQGNVDIWQQEGSTDPVHSIRGPGSVTTVNMSTDTSVTIANFASHLAVISQDRPGVFEKVDSLDIQAKQVKLLSRHGSHIPHKNNLLVLGLSDSVCTHVPGSEMSSMNTISQVYGQCVLTMDVRQADGLVAFGYSNYLYNMEYGVNLYDVKVSRQTASLQGYSAAPSCVNIHDAPPHNVVTGCRSSIVRVYDTRGSGGFPILTLQGHQRGIQTVQMDEWKVVSGGGDGNICVWDIRMGTKLWELHGRYPVQYAHFSEDFLVTANIPDTYSVPTDPFDNIPALRYRGSVHVYDFSADQTTKGLPDICSSTYDEPTAYNYNVRLAVPYDSIS